MLFYYLERKIRENAMGQISSWIHWLGEDIDKLKLVLSMTKDEEQKKILEEVIADLESKKDESDN